MATDTLRNRYRGNTTEDELLEHTQRTHRYANTSTTTEQTIISCDEKSVSYSLVSEEGRHKKLSASLRGERTSKDRSEARHQGVKIECNGIIVIPTRGVGNKRM
jgi:hypothetical protein